MGKRSIKENKNVYQLAREELNLTREQASDLLEYITSDRIEKIESEKSIPHPEEVLKMSECYKKPELCNYYCTHECAIGEKYVTPVETKDLSDITIGVIAALNRLNKEKERFIEIVEDGKITIDEHKDFKLIKRELDKISKDVSNLRLWLDKNINEGNIDPSVLDDEQA